VPSTLHRALPADAVDFPHCMFYRECALFSARPWGTRFDLGKDAAEAEQTAELVLEVIEEQGLPFPDGLPGALAAMNSVRVEEFDERMPALFAAHGLASSHGSTPYAADRVGLTLLLARLARLTGRPDDALAWARFGRELLATMDWGPYAYHLTSILFEKLIAGDPELTLTKADELEFDRQRSLPR